MKLIKCFFILFVCLCVSCTSQSEKINGVSFVGAPGAIDQSHVKPVADINANYATVMPFGFIRNLQDPNLIYNSDRQWFGETSNGTKQYIEELRKANIKIMIKPQIWVWRGEFTGEITMTSEADWKTFEASYSKFMLDYAQLAEDTKAEILCIGTELELFVKFRPKYWFNLIEAIRTKYSGQLTYASNWNEYRKTPFWNKLDYIGIDAYFPVSDKKTPTFNDCVAGWKTHKPIIKNLSQVHNKPVLFAEFGYRSVDFSGKEPWNYDRNLGSVNMQAQINTTKALFETFWDEDWFAGGFVWKWFHKHADVGGMDNPMFTPQNKPTEAVIASYYAKH